MTKRPNLNPLSILLLFVIASWPAMGLADSPRLSFVFFLVDDLGKHDLSCEGSRFYETPRIDALASKSMRFHQGYSCCQVCSPSRASIMLGQFTARHGITDWIGAASGTAWNRGDKLLPPEYVQQLPLSQTTFAEAFQQAGFSTFFAGKWHLGDEGSFPEDHGFDINIGGHHRGSPPGGYFSPYQNPKMDNGPAGEALALRLADETAAFIRDQPRDKPFLAMLSFYDVHGPVQTTRSLWQKYRDKGAKLPPRDSRFEIDRTLPVRTVQDHPIYAGMMETLDDAVGRVLDAIDAHGIADQTVVIFTSDNGGVASGDAYSTCNHPLRGGKGRQWEGGIRVPYYIHVPGVTSPGGQSNVPVTGADFYPTLLELAGLPLLPEQHLDGVSLGPLLKGETIPNRPLVWHYPHYGNQGGEPSGIYREGVWKLIHYYEDGRDELYRLDEDLGERNNLAAKEPERTANMRQNLLKFLGRVDAKFPQPDSRFTEVGAEARRTRIREVQLPQLERDHAKFLQSDFRPNPTWWGSLTETSE